MTDVNVVMAEGLVIGPDDRLVVKINDRHVGQDMAESLLDAFGEIGLKDRVLVLFGDPDMAKLEVQPTKEK